MRQGIFLAVVFLFVSACNTRPLGASQTVKIIMERTECYGPCPVYRLTIDGDGSVVYEGTKFVRAIGRQTATLSPDKVTQLISEFERADFFALTDSYENITVPDNPSVITSITLNSKNKTVRHYLGDKTAPKELTELENKIDEIVNSSQWTSR